MTGLGGTPSVPSTTPANSATASRPLPGLRGLSGGTEGGPPRGEAIADRCDGELGATVTATPSAGAHSCGGDKPARSAAKSLARAPLSLPARESCCMRATACAATSGERALTRFSASAAAAAAIAAARAPSAAAKRPEAP